MLYEKWCQLCKALSFVTILNYWVFFFSLYALFRNFYNKNYFSKANNLFVIFFYSLKMLIMKNNSPHIPDVCSSQGEAL